MFTISRFTCENLKNNCVTDCRNPRFSFAVHSERTGANVCRAEISVNGWTANVEVGKTVAYGGAPLLPHTVYEAKVSASSDLGELAEATLRFQTGKLEEKWIGQWITDGTYVFKEKKTSPTPLLFRKRFAFQKEIKRAYIQITALGIYDCTLNGQRVGDEYFAPGFTTYTHSLQYQTYDVTAHLRKENELRVCVAGGWAVGAFVIARKNRITAPRQALLAELRVEYADGSVETMGTDESWQVTRDGNLRFAEFYDGEIYDASVTEEQMQWHNVSRETVKIAPQIKAAYGVPVRAHEIFTPVSVQKGANGKLIYDFGQNFAGVVRFTVNGKAGQKLLFQHAEILTRDGELNRAFLRSAKCEMVYVCKDGKQTYSPRMTYMGFRYVSVEGVDEKDIAIEALALYSDIEQNGSFACSDERLNRLQSNIVWSGKSNLVDIPTDCPQRDERMGWTGDIAIFAPTACANFDMRRFLDKWLCDVRAEQTKGGGIPNVVPSHGYGFPATMPKKAIAFWGDACIFVPWALYLAYGDENVLRENYATMKKYIKACTFWAKLFSAGKRRYIWNDLPTMQFGDWVSPDLEKMQQWQARCKWTGTAAIAASAGILSKIAAILGEKQDEQYYASLREKTSDAYVSLFTDGNGKLKTEFQTAYVLPLHFEMFPKAQREKAVQNLVALVEKNNYKIGTGFPGTPYLLFALADNNRPDVAFKMLMNESCPSWLYEVKAGATTVWERWDALAEDGSCPIGDDGIQGGMISFNHYAFGAVGDFFYRRIAGIEPIEGGYQRFRVAPVIGGGITFAKADVQTPYGKICSEWQTQLGEWTLKVQVPVGTTCDVVMPSGKTYTVQSGTHVFVETQK